MAEYKKPVTPTDINVSTPTEFSTSTSIALSGTFAKIWVWICICKKIRQLIGISKNGIYYW